MEREKVLEILKEAEVLLEGHFLLTSGKHSNRYLQCAKIFKDTKYSEVLCKDLAEKFKDKNVDLVVGPAMGAVIMSYEVSRHLGVPNFFTERENGEMALRRGFEVKKGQRILVVEDVITTGGSVKEVIKLLTEMGGVKLKDADGWGYSADVKGEEELLDYLGNIMKAVRKFKNIQGFCYTQLTDVMQEANGLLDAERSPKVSLEKLQRFTKKPLAGILTTAGW